MDLGLAGRAYLVTGGTRGLGLATARVLVAEGARVVLSSRDPEHAAAAAAELGDAARGVAADNADPAAAETLVAEVSRAFGRCDGAVISVGGPPAGGVLDVTDAQWRDAFESVFLGAVRVARAVAAGIDGDGGAIAFVLSSSVKSPIGGLAISNGLRPGLAMVAKTLADELGPRGIRVLGLAPGLVRTERTAALYGDDAAQERMAGGIPLRRLGEPAEFGRVAAFAVSPAASYLTGCLVPVDGGALRAL